MIPAYSSLEAKLAKLIVPNILAIGHLLGQKYWFGLPPFPRK
jgi:hypothetical protein